MVKKKQTEFRTYTYLANYYVFTKTNFYNLFR